MIAVFFILTSLVILYFFVFQKRKNKLLIEKIEQQRVFEEELMKVQTEIQEETLKNIGRELHDNVGQLLSFVNMQLTLVSTLVSENAKEKVGDTKDVLKDAIQEIRALSKTLTNDIIINLGLQHSIQREINRLNKLNKIKGALILRGEKRDINPNDRVILFRIFQEFLSNTIKYSGAEVLHVILHFKEEHVELIAEDNGYGFDENAIKPGSGLINMKNRAKLINSKFLLTTKPNEGVKLVLIYPYRFS
ncbi:MAG: histidine kinase [Flavobacteriaceae bacterium]|nr:histidine kinase [Flavobacteriaceae bacterium]